MKKIALTFAVAVAALGTSASALADASGSQAYLNANMGHGQKNGVAFDIQVASCPINTIITYLPDGSFQCTPNVPVTVA